MRAGESDTAVTRDAGADTELAVFVSRLLNVPGWCGIDWIDSEGRAHILDINPRFTGDYPFVHMAGLDLPAALCSSDVDSEMTVENLVAAPNVEGYKEILP